MCWDEADEAGVGAAECRSLCQNGEKGTSSKSIEGRLTDFLGLFMQVSAEVREGCRGKARSYLVLVVPPAAVEGELNTGYRINTG